jgi:N-acetylmuramoyl-L-alanine amidase
MMLKYKVREGDCIASIAYDHGLSSKKIWEDATNRQLQQSRASLYLLVAGDTVYVPDLEKRDVACATGSKHRFRRLGVPEKLRLTLLDENEEPRRELEYTLNIDGQWIEGKTNNNGELVHSISPGARHATLKVHDDDNSETYELNIGDLDPSDCIRGVQQRLRNLGYDCGPIDGIWGPRTENGLLAFQRFRGIELTGKLDQETQRELDSMPGA